MLKKFHLIANRNKEKNNLSFASKVQRQKPIVYVFVPSIQTGIRLNYRTGGIR